MYNNWWLISPEGPFSHYIYGIKKVTDKEKENGNTKVIRRDVMNSAAGPEKGTTRVYDVPVKKTIVASGHKWIGDDEAEAVRPSGRGVMDSGTAGRGQTQVYGQPLRETQVYGQPLRETRVYEKPQEQDPPAPETVPAGRRLREAAAGAAARARGVYRDLRNVRVGDSAKFARFMKVTGVFALILLLEIGYFVFAHRTQELPEDIQAAKNELELTQKENAVLQEEIDALGSSDSIEEQRRSWERLKEKVEKAAAETSY